MTLQDQQQMIAKMISEKYRFYDTTTNDAIKITNDLIDIANGSKAVTLHSPQAKDRTLWQSVRRLKEGSGLFPTLYKFNMIWGADGEKRLLEYLYRKYMSEYRPAIEHSGRLNAWRKKHYAELKDMDIKSILW